MVRCTKPYQTERLPGAGLLRNLLRRYKEQPAADAASGSGEDAVPGPSGASPAGAATYEEVIGEMFAGGAQREDPPAPLARGGEYSGWVYTAPASKYDKSQVCAGPWPRSWYRQHAALVIHTHVAECVNIVHADAASSSAMPIYKVTHESYATRLHACHMCCGSLCGSYDPGPDPHGS